MPLTDGKTLPQSGKVGSDIHSTTWIGLSGGRMMVVVTVRNSVMITIARIRVQIRKTCHAISDLFLSFYLSFLSS